MNDREKGYKPNSRRWALSVYLTSEEMKKEWARQAKKHRMPQTKFVIYAVEEYIRQRARENTGVSRQELVIEVRELRRKNDELREENHRLKLLTKSLERELATKRFDRSYEEFTGAIRPDSQLIQELRKRGGMTSEEILETLGVSEVSDEEILFSINMDLEVLEETGVIRFDGKRWRWNLD